MALYGVIDGLSLGIGENIVHIAGMKRLSPLLERVLKRCFKTRTD